MTLAGIATMRSVDTATVLAGNIAFRQSALNAADQGLQAGFALVSTPLANPAADPTQDGMKLGLAGYYSSASPTEPNWSDPNTWTNPDHTAVQLNGGAPDAAGNVVWFIAERLCEVPNCKAGEACGGRPSNTCGSSPGARALSKEGEDNFRVTAALTPIPQLITHHGARGRPAQFDRHRSNLGSLALAGDLDENHLCKTDGSVPGGGLHGDPTGVRGGHRHFQRAARSLGGFRASCPISCSS